MIVQVGFTYHGVEHKVGEDFDLNLLDDEDRNDIFKRRYFVQPVPTKVVDEKHAVKILKKKTKEK